MFFCFCLGGYLEIGKYPIGSMHGIFTHISHENEENRGKYTIHGAFGNWKVPPVFQNPPVIPFEEVRCLGTLKAFSGGVLFGGPKIDPQEVYIWKTRVGRKTKLQQNMG